MTPVVALEDSVLGTLDDLGGEVTLAQVARHLGEHPRVVLGALNRLRADGRVVRVVAWQHQAHPAVWRRP